MPGSNTSLRRPAKGVQLSSPAGWHSGTIEIGHRLALGETREAWPILQDGPASKESSQGRRRRRLPGYRQDANPHRDGAVRDGDQFLRGGVR